MDEPCVFIIDDHSGVRDSLTNLFASIRVPAKSFATAHEFLQAYQPEEWGCLILDICLPGMSGLELFDLLRSRGIMLPVIFLTGFGNVSLAVDAMKGGAMHFLEKPPKPQELIDLVNEALARAKRNRAEESARAIASGRLQHLSRREKEVMDLIVNGMNVKQIAANLGLSHKTVQIHRTNLSRKLEIESVAELIRVSVEADGLKGLP